VAETEWLNETEQLAWQALAVLFLRGFPEIERALRDEGLLAVQYGVFAALSEAPDRTLRLGDLADHANMSQSRLTHRLRDLVERGDIRISPDPDDRRAKNATLTPRGMRRLNRVAPIHVGSVRKLVFDPLDDSQTEALADALSTIAAALSDHDMFTSATAV